MFQFNQEDVEIEIARIMREETIEILHSIALRQRGEAFIEVARELREDQLHELERAA